MKVSEKRVALLLSLGLHSRQHEAVSFILSAVPVHSLA